MTDITSILLIVKLVADGVGVSREIAELARRVLAGEEITEDEIERARQEMDAAVERFRQAAADRQQ